MGENSKIEWTDQTYNVWRGCRHVSAGCDHCYAETQSKRNPKVLGHWGEGAERVLAAESYRNLPYKWNEAAKREGVRRRVFPLSLGDWLDDEVPIPWLYGLLCDIEDCTALDWLLLTKRPENFRRRLEAVREYSRGCVMLDAWIDDDIAPPHVWIGGSAENQETLEQRLGHVLRIPAVVRFLSLEPLLSAVNLRYVDVDSHADAPDGFYQVDALTGEQTDMGRPCYYVPRVDWVIVGGESGPHARPMHPDWARSLRDQCQAAHVPFFFKQWGEWRRTLDRSDLSPISHWLEQDGRFFPVGDVPPPGHSLDAIGITRVGKKVAGCLLDGREWKEFRR